LDPADPTAPTDMHSEKPGRATRNRMASAPGYRISRLVKSPASMVENCLKPLAFGGPTRSAR
jgi:hypothetical protein